MKLWIDDERPIPQEFTHSALSSRQAVHLLESHQADIDVVSFDHDLGALPNGSGFTDDTSRPVLIWMIEHDVWPAEVRFHTANPVGREWLVGMCERYAPDTVLINMYDPWRDLPGMKMGR